MSLDRVPFTRRGVRAPERAGLRKHRGSMHRGIPRTGAQLRLPLVEVLARVDGLVLEQLEEGKEPARQQAAQQGSHPVDPVVAGEATVDDIRAEGARRIEGAAGVVVALIINKKSKVNAFALD